MVYAERGHYVEELALTMIVDDTEVTLMGPALNSASDAALQDVADFLGYPTIEAYLNNLRHGGVKMRIEFAVEMLGLAVHD